MSRKVYNKLVRDKIPAIIQADGKTPQTRLLNNKEYLEELIKKLEEECAELKNDQNAEELADIYEVLLALASAFGISQDELEKTRRNKATKRGAFKQKIFLEEVT